MLDFRAVALLFVVEISSKGTGTSAKCGKEICFDNGLINPLRIADPFSAAVHVL